MSYRVRQMDADDRPRWAEMRNALWPEESPDGHRRGIARILASDDEWGFAMSDDLGQVIGFAELAIRKYANGCESAPVPFLEGIWIDPAFRRKGASRALLAHIEAFVIARGFREIGSDALIENTASHAAHARWGFAETERVVCFRKVLGA